MKKLLLLLLGVVVSLAVHADILYLMGSKIANSWTNDLTTVTSWTCSSPFQVNSDTDGYFKFKAEGYFKIATDKATVNDDGGWSYFDSKTIRPDSWTKNGNIWTGNSISNSNNNVTAPDNGTIYYRIKKNGDSYTFEAAKSTDAFDGGNTSTEHTIYFYDSDESLDGKLGVHIWNEATAYLDAWGQDSEKLTSTGKYLLIDGTYYPVWSYTLTWNYSTGKLKFWKKDGNNVSGYNNTEYDFTPGTVYNKSGKTNYTSSDLVDKIVTEYTIYFYAPESADITPYAHVFGKSTDVATKWPGTQMTSTGKYIMVGTEYWPCWKITFTGTNMPESVMFNGGGENSKWTKEGGIDFINNAFYKYDNGTANESGVTGKTLVDKQTVNTGDVTIYMHFKEDYLKEAATWVCLPKVHVYSGNYDDNGKNGTKYFLDKQSKKEEMTLVNERYQIYAYTISKENLEKLDQNNIHFTFYFYENKDYTSRREYNTNAINYYDQANWSKYIFTTEDGNRAPQSYLSYEEFLRREELAKDTLYVSGAPELYYAQDKALSWEVTKPYIVTSEDDVFYLALIPQFTKLEAGEGKNYATTAAHQDKNGKNIVGFKVTFLNIADILEKEGLNANTANSSRLWATFNLGTIGVNDLDSRLANKIDIDVYPENGHPGQLAKFNMNTSVSFLNYNQYNWTLVEGKATSGTTYYAVFDLHEECRSVTLCTVDPHPSLTMTPGTPSTLNDIDSKNARLIHKNHLKAANAYNGHILMQDVNTASATAEIKAAPGGAWEATGFSRKYSLYVNGDKVAETSDDANKLEIEYMPISAVSDSVSLRAKYTDNDTKITFHSRIRKTPMETGDATLHAPIATDKKGTLYFERYTEDGETAIYGLYIPDLDCEINDNNLNRYADVEFFVGCEEKDVEFIHENSAIKEKWGAKITSWGANGDWGAWTPAASEADFTSDNNWSKRLHALREHTPVFIHDVVRVKKGTKVTANDYPEVTGNLWAVYPFIYNPNAEVHFGGNNAPARSNAEAQNIDFSKMAISNTRLNEPFKVTIEGAVSAVEDIAVDAKDANAPVEYYTISGVRVMGTPAPGIYVRRQGNTVSKVVIK